MKETGRNDPCPCGSGKKYKKCCMGNAATQNAPGQTAKSASHGFNATNVAPPSELLLKAVALHQAGQLDEAKAVYLSLLKINPDDCDALHYLGMIAFQKGDYREAINLIEQAIKVNRNVPAFHCNLGNAYRGSGQLDSAVAAFQEAVRLDPEFQAAYSNLGNALLELERFDEATTCYKKALSLRPDFAEAHYNLGNAFDARGEADAAIESYRKALALKQDYAEAHSNLGNTLKDQGNLDEAVTCCRKALALKSDFIDAYITLGCALRDQGKFDAADESFRHALSIKPGHAIAYSNLLFLYSYQALLDPHEYLAQARGWELACLTAQDRQAARDRIFRRQTPAGRRLKVGYVSGDFRQHAVSYFVEQLFARHDRARIELFAYSAHGKRDAVTERLQSLVEHWASVVGVPDAATRNRIEADGIDVLVDLSGDTAFNRKGVFALRAAPVQVQYLGLSTSGLTEMDYFIGDETLTPPETDSHFSERVWRLPRVWQSYGGKADAPPPGWRPARDGAVWVGSFTNLNKLMPFTLNLWARVLHALPEAKLLLKAKELADAGNRRRILDSMAAHGIAPERIELQDWGVTPDWLSHMAYYDRLDIALDPAGVMSGTTTTSDALWMGVPVITLEGNRMGSRMTVSLLDAIGHPEWVARSEAEYVDKVVALAKNVEQRKALRATQRERMARSPLCDARGLAMCMENAYFEMFERWFDLEAVK